MAKKALDKIKAGLEEAIAAERAFWLTVKAPVLTQADYDAARKKWAQALRQAEADAPSCHGSET